MIQSQCIRKILPVLSKHKQNAACVVQNMKLLNYCRLRYYSTNIRDESASPSTSNNIDSSVSSASGLELSGSVNKPIVSSVIDDDDEDPGFKAVLSAVTPNIPPPAHVDIVPGKGPPPEPPVTCCMSGCANCVWIQYAEELKDYFNAEEGSLRAKEAIEQIDNPGLQMFLKLELGLL